MKSIRRGSVNQIPGQTDLSLNFNKTDRNMRYCSHLVELVLHLFRNIPSIAHDRMYGLVISILASGLLRPISTSIINDPEISYETPTFKDSSEKSAEQLKMFFTLTKHPYDTLKRPRHNNNPNDTSPVHVRISLDLVRLVSVDEVRSEYTVSLKMDMQWFDHRLRTFRTTADGKPEVMSIEPNYFTRIWLPQMGVPELKEPGMSELVREETVTCFKIRSDGLVFLRTFFKLKSFCRLNFRYYPFDVQTCTIKLESRTLPRDELFYKWHEHVPFKNSDHFQLTGFILTAHDIFNDSALYDDHEKEWEISRIGVKLTLKREWYHFLLDVYLPSALFVVMSWITFWLEISAAPARVTLGTTSMLTLVTSSMFSRERLPRVPYIHSLDMWIAVCICFVFLSLIEYALVSHLYTKDKSKRERLKQLQMELSTLSLATMATHNVSRYLDVPDLPRAQVSMIIPTLANNLRRLSSESKSTCNLLDVDAVDPIEKYSKEQDAKTFCRKLFRCSTDELAVDIDRKSRSLFPLCFILFNVIYWTSVNI